MHMEKDQIIQQLRTGQNQEALQELYKNFPTVNHFIRTHGGNEDDSRDIFQESLLILYKNAQKESFTLSSSPGTYLFSVAKYLWKDELRKKNRTVSFEIENYTSDPVIPHSEESHFEVIDKVLENLGEKCSGILKLFYYNKKTMEEIARELDYKNVETAKTQKYKCLERARIMASELMVSYLKDAL